MIPIMALLIIIAKDPSEALIVIIDLLKRHTLALCYVCTDIFIDMIILLYLAEAVLTKSISNVCY
jgi:hypothetical protein